MKINPLTAIDFYKADHRRQYPKGTTEVYSNLTARTARLAKCGDRYDHKIVFFGLQFFIKDFLIDCWTEEFFKKPKEKVLSAYKRRMDASLGKNAVNVDHISALHDLGYLPVKIKALPEGSRVNIGVPVLTVVNMLPQFFWLTNYLETVISSYLWKPITSATIAFEYKKLLLDYAFKTGAPLDFIQFQGHDFSFRGMSGVNDAALSGCAHLTSFVGTDTVAAIDLAENYYGADSEKELVGCSVPATEHSVMCMGEKDGEIETFKRLISELYPRGIVSIVSDTWDFWKVLTDYMPRLKSDIMSREGKVVIRPDSGDPIDIICGDDNAPDGTPQNKGAVECLWEVFGGTQVREGGSEECYKLLDDHVGLIYGDSITIERAQSILEKLRKKGFCSANIVFGIGSYTYQHVTRDTFGFAMKATSGVVNGERREIFKDPITDSGFKKSAKGLLRVEKEGAEYCLFDKQDEAHEAMGELCEVYNGKDGLLIQTSLREIREVLEESL